MPMLAPGTVPPGYPDVVPPKFATARDFSRPTRGKLQGQFADIWLNKPLLPHQQYIADVAGELLPNGLPRYTMVIVTFQRQGGKTHLSFSRNGERCMCRRNFRSFYTAQTGGDAQDQFLKFNDELVIGSPLERLVVTRRGNGKADMTFPNGSTIRPMPPTEGAGHGKQSDAYDVDEAWYFDEDQGGAIMQAIGPTQLTRPGAQTWIWSAGGTAASTWLASLVARGRAGDPTIAYFEWGVPDDLDINDLPAVLEYHPAKGHLITLDSLRALRALIPDDAEFARAAGNRWTEVIGGAIGWAPWQTLRWTTDAPEDAPIGYGAARAESGQHVVIAGAWNDTDADGNPVKVAEILDVIPVHGAAERVKFWAEGESLVIDPTGPSAALSDAVKLLGLEPHPFTGRDSSAACTNVLDAVVPRTHRYRQHDILDDAVKVAGTRRLGDGGKAWAVAAAAKPIAALEAVTGAFWALDHRPPEETGVPLLRFGKTT